MELEIKNNIIYISTLQKMKYLCINLTIYKSYVRKTVKLIKEIKVEINK